MKKSIIALILALTPPLAAHVAYHERYDYSTSRPYKIKQEIEKSIALYSHFSSPEDLDMVTFTLEDSDFDPALTLNGQFGEVEEGQESLENEDHPLVVTDDNGVTGRRFHVGSLVPGCASYAMILPIVAIVGPEQEYLPAWEGSEHLPFTLQEGQGMMILDNEEQGDLWYEKFTFKSYFDQKKTSIILSRPGTYLVYVWEPRGNTGDYVLELGDIEVFGVPEIIRAMWYENYLVYDGEITCQECVDELEEVDGPNPTIWEIIDRLMFIIG
ncbi:MAG: hypothetical protein CVV44_06780 [Spirochaetae bacterium HGW-Spirochaetae-1]|nr:MAG: hypothetical protein CVV44_06780 [Spirochaetae bacterium HGW-Spirochaetae-1]